MNRDPSQPPDVLAWVQPFFDTAEPSPTTIPFEFLSHNHIDTLLIKIWAARRISTHPPSFQGQVNKLIDTVSMLYHEIMGHFNSPLSTTRAHVLEKQLAFFIALEGLLCDPANRKGANKVWVRQNVIDVLLNPPSPPQSFIQRSISVLTNKVSFLTPAWHTPATMKGETPRDADEESGTGTTTQISAAETSLRRRTVFNSN